MAHDGPAGDSLPAVAPLGRKLRVTARTLSSRARMVQAEGEVRLADEPETILADARGTFLPITEEYRAHVLAEHPELRSFFDWGESNS